MSGLTKWIINFRCVYSFTSTVVTGLSPGHDYEFRVYAENVYGRSQPSESSSIIRTKELLKKPPKTKRYEGKIYTYSSTRENQI